MTVGSSSIARDFLAFSDTSPTPAHVVGSCGSLLKERGFAEVGESHGWPTAPGKYFLKRNGSLVAWIEPESAPAHTGFRILGAHTDSPHLRVKQHHDRFGGSVSVVALEPYGGPILSTWFDRDLGLAGNVVLNDLSEHLVMVAKPLIRVPNVAIHLDREQERPNVQKHLNGLWGPAQNSLLDFVAEHMDINVSQISGYELQAFDTQPATFLGEDDYFISASRLDNQATVWAALQALVSAQGGHRMIVAFFDHEEVGSQSERGAGSPLLTTVLERIVLASGGTRDDFHRACAASIMISGDMAHGTHPNFPEKHEPLHLIGLGAGPVLKVNTNLRYATDARGAAFFAQACAKADVPMQRFVNRADLPCGSTIGPISATQSGITTVDVGAPQLAMHSIREIMARTDLEMYAAALTACLEIDGFVH